jgi:aldehyde:ferredoxin oxidoreductase
MVSHLFSYAGKVLRINLTTSRIEKEQINESEVKMFLGGRGLNVKTLFDNVGPGVSSLHPENLLIFGVVDP